MEEAEVVGPLDQEEVVEVQDRDLVVEEEVVPRPSSVVGEVEVELLLLVELVEEEGHQEGPLV